MTEREKVRFASGGDDCAAWYYPGTSGTCVIMCGGFAVTKEPGTDRFARRFQEAGFGVLAFDPRRLGESGGTPRQVVRIKDELADWRAAIEFARTLPGVDPDRIALWGFSSAGGHVLRTAARDARVAAAIAQTPGVDGLKLTRNAARHQRPSAMLRLTVLGLADAVLGLAGRPPRLVPLGGRPGTVAALTTPDAIVAPDALDPDGRYSQWQQNVAARSTFGIGSYRPGRDAARVRCPLLVVVADQDQSALPGPSIEVARQAPRGELFRVPGGHYAPFLDAHERVVEAEVAFLRRHLIAEGVDAEPAAGAQA
ncbi:alpha/beta hydrolase [Actinomadura barringtoniae]|uniref:Alpha/beta hydrolase n=1 Tax=Actinomadura barringtoniae TaxID=1427535 RepID=A0A939P6A7_9ACTN|nr:alpha/beta hydrolase [Actinomadura barringtoniae]MBO2446113.1 alpha/beta hydrolase [Actinomadura barringtoniae]